MDYYCYCIIIIIFIIVVGNIKVLAFTETSVQMLLCCRPGDEPEEDTILCNRYLLPMTLSQCFNDALKDPNITVSNYKQRMHALLHLEEYAQIKALTRSEDASTSVKKIHKKYI